MQFTEHSLELSIMELFENEGYTHQTGQDIHRQKTDVLLPELLATFLRHRYAADFLSESEIVSIITQLKNISGSDYDANKRMLAFPCLASYTTLALPAPGGIRRLFIHHGHLYSREELSDWLPKGTIIISGHTHVTVMEEEVGLFYFNPGSISLPKCSDGNTCGILELKNDTVKVSLYTIEGKLLRESVF